METFRLAFQIVGFRVCSCPCQVLRRVKNLLASAADGGGEHTSSSAFIGDRGTTSSTTTTPALRPPSSTSLSLSQAQAPHSLDPVGAATVPTALVAAAAASTPTAALEEAAAQPANETRQQTQETLPTKDSGSGVALLLPSAAAGGKQ